MKKISRYFRILCNSLASIGLILISIPHVYANSQTSSKQSTIPTRYIPKLNQSVTFLGLGTVPLGRDWGIDKNLRIHPSENTAKEVLQTAVRSGFTLVDSASSYGLSEERIGKYIPQKNYHYLLITKPGEHNIAANDSRCKVPAYDYINCAYPAAAYDFSRQAILNDVEKSLQNLHVKKIDIVLLHLDSKDAAEVMAAGEALNALKDLRKQGKISYIGVSLNGPLLKDIIKKYDIDVVELEYNLLNQSNKEAIDLAHAKGMGVIIRGGLGTGLLTSHVAAHLNDPNLPYKNQIKALVKLTQHNYDKLTALALAFLYENQHISSVIVGANQPEYIRKDIELLNRFNDPALLAKAKKLMTKFEPPKDFTEIMGEFYAKN